MGWCWGLKSGPWTCCAGTILLELSPSRFCFSYFSSKVLCFMRGPSCIVTALIAGITMCSTMTGLFVEMGVLLTFCPGWPWTLFLLRTIYQSGCTQQYYAFLAKTDMIQIASSLWGVFWVIFKTGFLVKCQHSKTSDSWLAQNRLLP
jgi:hypothetical protein